MTAFKPMLASPADLDTLRYPLLASPKLDGIRAIVNGSVVSRKLIDIPNLHVQKLLRSSSWHGLDGELIVGSPTAPDVYRRTSSAVMSIDGEPRFTFYVFDHWQLQDVYHARSHQAMRQVSEGGVPHVQWHRQTLVHSRDELDAFEAECIEQGYEGIITRDPHGLYKHGRSTAREQIMLKVKRFEDGEAEVIGHEEEMANLNEAGRDNLGRTKRSHAQAGKVGKGTMGALIVRDLKTRVVFNIGTGFTAADRQAAWPIGEIVKYKFFAVGVKDKPRHPVFIGRRSKIDL